ncbi:hypothetical protein C8J57DRAFT_1518649 [Mycena rebaudengoi]|nr:hypothetical protein C8J57DRAFT_1518649 [Mycena rebaudengoi]
MRISNKTTPRVSLSVSVIPRAKNNTSQAAPRHPTHTPSPLALLQPSHTAPSGVTPSATYALHSALRTPAPSSLATHLRRLSANCARSQTALRTRISHLVLPLSLTRALPP